MQRYEDGVAALEAGIAAQSQGGERRADECFNKALGLFKEALNTTYATADEKVAAATINDKMREYVRMLEGPRTIPRGTHTDVNILDMNKLPTRFQRIQNAFMNCSGFEGRDVFESLQGTFGFQKSNVANQKEHVMLLLANFAVDISENAVTEAITKFRARLFDNYTKWCKYVKESPKTGGDLVDIALFFLMWGEASNFRQTPELLCWLFHNLVKDVRGSQAEPGSFLTTYIRPMYLELQKESDKKTSLGQRAPHTELRNYDDFNEFFWTKACLKYTAANIAEAFGSVDKKGRPNVVKKTFLERRSWFRALLSFRRIFLTNLLLFLATIAFSLNMVFVCPDNPIMYGTGVPDGAKVLGKAYTSGSKVGDNTDEQSQYFSADEDGFVNQCNVAKLTTCLGIDVLSTTTFTTTPTDFRQLMNDVPFTNCLDLVTGRCTCYLDLLETCFSQKGEAKVLTKNDEDVLVMNPKAQKYDNSKCLPNWYKNARNVIIKGGKGQLNCQACQWSLTSLSSTFPIFLGKVLDFSRPDLGPLLLLGAGSLIGLAIFWQLQNRLFSGIGIGYVGRSLYVPFMVQCRYTCFWIFLFIIKLWFDYRFMIKSLVETSLFVYVSDPEEYLKVAYFMLQIPIYNYLYIFFLWLPTFLVFMYDAQIFYAVFSVFYGSVAGFNLKIGELRSFSVLRLSFGSIPKMFNRKMVANLIEPPKDKSKKKMDKSDEPMMPPERQFLSISNDNGLSPLKVKTTAYSSLLEQDALSERATEVLSMADLPQDKPHRQSTSSSSSSSMAALDTVFGLTGPMYQRTIPFAMAWNQCLVSMREADILSNRELRVLRYLIDAASERIYMPVFLTAGKLDESINIVLECSAVYTRLEKDKKKDKALEKVQKNMIDRLQKDSLRLQAIYGSYIFTSKVLKVLLGDRHQEIYSVFAFVEESIITKNVLKGLVLSDLHAIRTASSTLMQTIMSAKRQSSLTKVIAKAIDQMETLVSLFKNVVRKQDELVVTLDNVTKTPEGFFDHSSGAKYPLKQLQAILDDEAAMDLVSRAYYLLTVDNVDAEPRSPEGKRRLRFFANSLFMAMPEAKPIENMHSFSIATPYFNEIVLFSLDELTSDNDDMIKLLYYLQTIHPFEWTSLLERCGVADTAEAIAKFPQEVQLWASYRGQTLARTVRGMMYHEESIRFLAWLEVGENEPMHARGCHCKRCEYLDEMVALKFSYVCTCQIYGVQKANNSQQATDIDFLMKRHPGFRVAYVDKKNIKDAEGTSITKYYSVLLKAVGDLIVEVYRVELPGNPIIGEGKPENQNHAVIFSRGEFVQCIDMNQDGYLEECLKMPNLLATVDDPKHSKKAPVTIIGFREYVFTGGVSNLANFMQIQELSFVSLGQRMLAMFHVRQHYGHPDVFDKVFAMTTGGTAKSSKGINLSEDIFAGFNTTLRGGRVTHEEFIQVGKGRDVGMQQLALFEAKLSSGAGECVTSRDAMRMALRLDYFRLNSWFYGNLGWYFTQTMTVFAIYAFIYGKMYFCLSGLDKFYLQTGRMGISGVLNTSWALQFGFLLVVPVIAVIGVERGFRHGINYLLWNVLTLGPLFFTFQMGNRMHYFDRTLIHGGAKYRATGRGFTIKHEKFAELFRFYAFSHFYRGVELGVLLLIWSSYGTFSWCNCSWTMDNDFYKNAQPLPEEWNKRCYAAHYQQCVAPTEQSYGIMSYSLWLVAATWLWAPFLFNPSGLDWDKIIEDYSDWQNWLQTKNDSTQSWLGWWTSEVSAMETSTGFSRFVFFMRKMRFFFLAFGIYLHMMYRIVYADRNQVVATDKSANTLALMTPYIIVGGLFVLILLLTCVGYVSNRITKKWNKSFKQKRLRRLKFNLSLIGLFAFIIMLIYLNLADIFEASLVIAITSYWFLQLMLARLKYSHVIIETMAFFYDTAVGWIVFGPVLFIAMFMPFLSAFQQRVMFNSAFTSGLEVSKLFATEKSKKN
ncbi:callose synthase [Thraustotheca clavata]|uniref:1,3-beta-glucan synthase n=1 Tax=Thraustotheca clavata TaxID=74557 RepID=A0A1W0A1I6_9STRA|nr:callose synthase [Thraustotheca clavata]